MESITLAAIASTLIFKAFEKTGESLGEGFSKTVGWLLKFNREEFESKRIEGIVKNLEEDPSEVNKTIFTEVLKVQLSSDREFSEKLENLINDIRSEKEFSQVAFDEIDIQGSAEIGNIRQSSSGADKSNQRAFTNVRVGKNLKMGDIDQKS